jgi:broad specificity phosphatase PhoE
LILVRHGQTESNLNRKLQGQSDGPLTETGRGQAEKLARHLRDWQIDQIFSSDLRRACDTAAAIAAYHAVQPRCTALAREWNVGLLDGMPAEALAQALGVSILGLPGFRPKGGETLDEVRQRAAALAGELAAAYAGQTVLLCSHGDFLRMLLGVLLDKDIEEANTIHLRNASYTVLEQQPEGWKVLALDQVPP